MARGDSALPKNTLVCLVVTLYEPAQRAEAIEPAGDPAAPVPARRAGMRALRGRAVQLNQPVGFFGHGKLYTTRMSCDKHPVRVPLGDRLMVGQRTLTPPV